MRYLIHESNLERLEKKLTTISNKCKKYNCEFQYEVVGEQFVTTEERVDKYIEVEVEGTAKVNDWVFVATINFHEAGNVVRKCGNIEVEIPERFYMDFPYRELKHNTIQPLFETRTDYIIYKVEFKRKIWVLCSKTIKNLKRATTALNQH